jgi:hypothetical protein
MTGEGQADRRSATAGAGRLRLIIPLAGLALLAVLFVQLGPGQILSLLRSMGPNLPIVILIFGCHESVRALALNRCLQPGHRPPFRQLLWIRFAGEAVRTLTHTGPVLSEPARGWMLTQQGLHGVHAYGAAFSELIANSVVSAAVTVVVLAAVLWKFDLGHQLVVLSQVLVAVNVVYTLIGVVALATRVHLIGAIARGAGRLPLIGRRLRTNPDEVWQMEEAIFDVLRDRPATLVQVVLLECVAQVLLVFEVYWALRSMGLSITFGTALLVEALTKIANGVQVVGATEGGYALVFNWLGLPAVAGFTLSFVKRVRSLAVAGIGLGLLALVARTSRTSGTSRRTS